MTREVSSYRFRRHFRNTERRATSPRSNASTSKEPYAGPEMERCSPPRHRARRAQRRPDRSRIAIGAGCDRSTARAGVAGAYTRSDRSQIQRTLCSAARRQRVDGALHESSLARLTCIACVAQLTRIELALLLFLACTASRSHTGAAVGAVSSAVAVAKHDS